MGQLPDTAHLDVTVHGPAQRADLFDDVVRIRASNPGVMTGPGVTMFTRILADASSLARQRVKLFSAALAAP